MGRRTTPAGTAGTAVLVRGHAARPGPDRTPVPAARPGQDTGPCLAALVNLTVPLATALGHYPQ